MLRLIASLSLAASVAGCAGREPRSARCEWRPEAAEALDVTKPAQVRHLRDDARAAEALAVTFADLTQGLEQPGRHRESMERCEGILFNDIARVHHVTPEDVRVALGRQNDTPFDR